MSKKVKNGASSFWVIVMTVGILGCLGGVFYTFYMMQQESGQEGEYRLAAHQMRLLSHQIAADARATAEGDAEAFEALDVNVREFTEELGQMESVGLGSELRRIEQRWEPVAQSARALVEAGDRVVFLHSISTELEENIKPIQSEFAAVVDILRDEEISAETIVAAQNTLWLTERIARNIEKILEGTNESQAAADEFRTDAAEFLRTVDALNNGSRVMGVDQLTDPDAIEAVRRASALFAVVSTSIEQIASAAPEMREAALAREQIVQNSNSLTDAVSALEPAIEKMAVAQLGDRSTLMALFGAPALLSVGLLVAMYRNQRRRVVYTEQGVAEINGALVKIAEGDLTVKVPESNSVTRDIAREINASTQRQRELIRNIKTPFEVSAEGITEIGISAEGQVSKGRELTRAVADSVASTTEMVRTSEKIKSSTVEAASTSERNRQRVAQGYELTKDMSKASADVREAVQETSKSAKRQSELIQSVTAAAEYIQALNTKISVVAINTRIEAEKAGEHGRPFLGIAEAIGDLLREAEEEGRKIISEVRMLQNLSGDNLSSMETTVGTVVTILEYIDRLDTSLEEINAGSSAITAIVNTVDEAAGQSANTSRSINAAMDEIRERNLDISEYSESTQLGVKSLKASMRKVAESLSHFRIERNEADGQINIAEVEDLKQIQSATKIYREEEMQAMEESPGSAGIGLKTGPYTGVVKQGEVVTVENKPDIVSLKWVTGLMITQADSAETALVDYSNDPSQKKPLLRCMWAVHQITSTLRALGMRKAEMLTLEMERTLNFLYKDKLAGERRKLAMGGLMQALKIIPAYLDHTQAARVDTGRGLEQYVNDLRRWVGEKPRPRAFFYHMEIPAEAGITQDAARSSDEEIRSRANVMLALYLEMAKQGLRRRNPVESMKTVARIARKMQMMFAGSEPERYWFAMIGLCEGIASGLIVPDECIAQIFKSGAFAIKYARENGGEIDARMDYEGYLQQMLYYIASCRSKPVHIAAIRDAFGIDDSTIKDAGNGLIHSDAIIIAINGSLEQLNKVVEFLNTNDFETLSQEDANPGDSGVAEAVEALDAAENRLIAAGQLAHADSLNKVQRQFKTVAGGARRGSSHAMAVTYSEIVQLIVDVTLDLEHKLEHGLASSVSGREYERRESVIKATFNNMGLVENYLHQILRRKSLKSALDKKPCDDSSSLRLTTALQRYLNKSDKGHEDLRKAVRDADNGDADPDLLYSLAREFLDEQESTPDRRAIDAALRLMEDIVGALYFSGMEREGRVIEGCQRWLTAASDAGAVREDDAFRCFAEAFAHIEMHMQRSLIDPLDDTSHMFALAEQRVAELGQFTAKLSPGRKAGATTPGAQAHGSLVKDAAIPSEFREVFIEESEEIVTELARLTKDWLNEPEVNETLRDIRRHFHTFKGNGRAVGANVLGELGWAAQDMLDRSLDGDLTPGSDVQHLVGQVVEALPGLVQSYSREDGPDVERIRHLTNECFAVANAGAGMSVQGGAETSGRSSADSPAEPLSH